MISPVFAQYQPPHTNPGPAVDRIQFKKFDVDFAPTALQNQEMDLYLFSLKTEAARRLLGNPDVKIYEAPATMISIVLNPAPPLPGELNPFSIREVRAALQYIVNRDFVVEEIYKGFAAPMITHVSPLDFDYLTVSDIIRQMNIRNNPDLAKQIVTDAMSRAGASLQDGVWTYNGKPVRLKFIIRVEDERRDVGDLISDGLRRLGFFVQPIFQTFGDAIARVYGTDPAVFEWHLYTEGWGRGSPERYDFATFNQMCAPWLGNMPGWLEVGFSQYENPELDAIGQRLFTGNFSGVDDRNQLYAQGTRICFEESVRIWVATVVNNFPATKSLEGVTLDLIAGPRSIATLREAYIPGKTELTVGNLWVWTPRTIWNPVGGFGDVFSIDIWRNLFDPPTWRNPFTGIPQPFRAQYSVETAGPDGKLTVPPDAVVWDSQAGRWRNLGQGVQATSKVTFNYKQYFSSKWHDGQNITMGDLFFAIFQVFDLTYNLNKSKVEFATATVNRPYLDTFKGFRIVNDTSVEVYVNFWFFVSDYIAEYASVTSLSMPWQVLSAMDNLVFDKRRFAYSDTAASRFNVDWLSLVENRHARQVKDTLEEFLGKSFYLQNVFSVGGRVLVNVEEARSRYLAAKPWFDEHGHMVISNGPFSLARFDAPAQFAEIVAFRDASYPFTPGKWFFGEPQSIEIVKVEGDFIPIGGEGRFTVEVRGPGQLRLAYVLFDPSKGLQISRGEANRLEGNRFVIELPRDLTSRLEPGSYQLLLTAFSDAVSIVDERVQAITASTTQVTTTIPTTPPGQIPSVFDPTLVIGGAGAAVLVLALLLVLRRRTAKSS